MAKMNIAGEIEALVKSGNATVVANNKFVDGAGNALGVRSMDSINDPLEIGDTITIPQDYKVLSTKIGEGENARTVCFTMATVTTKGGDERVMRFFPNSLAKIAFPLDESGRRLPKVKTGGKVAAWYQEQNSADEAVAGLVGKKIVVTDKASYKVHNNLNNRDENTNIFSYDFAD